MIAQQKKLHDSLSSLLEDWPLCEHDDECSDKALHVDTEGHFTCGPHCPSGEGVDTYSIGRSEDSDDTLKMLDLARDTLNKSQRVTRVEEPAGILGEIASEAATAASITAAQRLIKKIKVPLIKKMQGGKNNRHVSAFLGTDIGTALLSILLSGALQAGILPLPEKFRTNAAVGAIKGIASGLRVNAFALSMDTLVEVVVEPLAQIVGPLLKQATESMLLLEESRSD